MDTPSDWTSRWKHETKCSVRELAKLCHGWNPDSDVLPDPVLYNATVAMILRAVRAENLHPIAVKVPLTAEDFFYGEGPFFLLREAAAWAVKHFPAFHREEAWFDQVDATGPSTGPESSASASTWAPTIENVAPALEAFPHVKTLQIDGLLQPGASGDGAEAVIDLLKAERAERLAVYMTTTGVTIKARIYRAAKVDKREFGKWVRGTLSPRAASAVRLEHFLREAAPP